MKTREDGLTDMLSFIDGVMYPDFVEYNPKDFTARFNGCIWHEIWRVFPGLQCVAVAGEYTFYTNAEGSHYFTIERGEDE